MIADLHPTHATEPTPLFYEALRAHNVAAVTRDVQTGLADVVPIRRDGAA